VIVFEGGKVLGLLSQRQFFEQMSRPYTRELSLRRPMKVFLETYCPGQLCILPCTCKIDLAVQKALGRSPELVYEPIIVVAPDQKLYSIDLLTILSAQTQILRNANVLIEEQRSQTLELFDCLKIEQNNLETKQQETERAYQILKSQQIKLRKQTKRIADLNRRIVNISYMFSAEGKKAFQATFDGANSICHSINLVYKTSALLEKDLEIVNTATREIEQVNKLVNHLSLQASILVNRHTSDTTGFEIINAEIKALSSQANEANAQVHKIAFLFRERIDELVAAGRNGEKTAHNLIIEIQKAEAALTILENLVGELPNDVEKATIDSPSESVLSEQNRLLLK
jgi:hypothetical protein